MASGTRKEALTSHQQAETGKEKTPRSLLLTLISVSAALYATATAVTSPIPTPWGVGNFRPGVLVPAFFAVVCGPWVGGAGAAIGCFVGDFALSMFGLTNPLLSLIAGVPGNFVAFYLLGWLVSRYRSWASFVASSFVALIVGNLIAASGVVAFFSFIVPDWASWTISVKLATLIGLTFFWVTTMAIFVIPLTPVLVRSAKPVLSRIKVETKAPEMIWGSPVSLLRSTISVAAVLAVLYVVGEYTPFGSLLFSSFWIRVLLLIAAAVVLTFGVAVTLFLNRCQKPLS